MILIDKYIEANKSANERIATDPGEFNQLGQSFTGNGRVLEKITLYLQKYGSPTEYIYLSIYAHSGTYGTSSVPTGSVLATSNYIKSSDLATSNALVDFTFTGTNKITLVNSTKYVWVITTTAGTSTNNVQVGADDSSPAHGGNICFHTVGGAWSPVAGEDAIFYIWGSESSQDVRKIVTPTKLLTTKEINGAWFANMEMAIDKYLQAERYVAIETEEYIVKKCKAINDRGKLYNSVELDHVMSELSNYTIDRFKYTDTVSNILDLILVNTNWTRGTVNITATVTIENDSRITVLEALYILANACGGELYFNSDKDGGATDRTVDIKSELGTRTNRLLRADKNCSYIEKEEDSTNLVTKIFPYGPDNAPMNSEILDDMDDEALYTPSGAGTATASKEKMQGTQAIQFFSTTLDETFIRDFGAGGVKDLSSATEIRFKVYAPNGIIPSTRWTIGIGEAAYSEQTYLFPPVANQGEGNWREMVWDISAINPASRNAIRYLGFKHGTADDDYLVVDDIRFFNGNDYIESPYINNYKVPKEKIFNHTLDIQLLEGELDIKPSDDTYAYEKYPTQNNGSKVNIYIRNYSTTSVDAIGYFKFALTEVPEGATVTSATLYLNCEQVNSGGVTGELYECDADWGEMTLTNDNKPGATGAKIADVDLTSTGCKTVDITTVFNAWLAGGNNYGLRLFPSVDQNKSSVITSKEGSNAPYIKVEYSNSEEVNNVLIAEATKYLYQWHIPILSYGVKFADLSKAIIGTWSDETVSLGDTLKIQDGDLGINVEVRIKKIVEDILNPANTQLTLTNRKKNIADTLAQFEKKLRAIMPFENNSKIILANTIQKGYLGI